MISYLPRYVLYKSDINLTMLYIKLLESSQGTMHSWSITKNGNGLSHKRNDQWSTYSNPVDSRASTDVSNTVPNPNGYLRVIGWKGEFNTSMNETVIGW